MPLDRRAVLAGAAALVAAGPRHAMRSAPLELADFIVVAEGLPRPECVATLRDGRLVVSTMDGSAVVLLDPRGGLPAPRGVAGAATGIALDARERVIVANFGLLKNLPGGLDRLDLETGAVEPLVGAIDGRALVGSNAPVVARDGSIYCTHSRWRDPQAVGSTEPEGFVYLRRPDGGFLVVAEGLPGANGTALDRDDTHLYVSLTPLGLIRRFRRRRDGSLGPGEDFGPVLGAVVAGQTVAEIRALAPADRARLGYVDNIAFDAAGNLWVCLPFANRIVALTPGGERIDIVHDADGSRIANPTALAWGGADLRDLYVVCRAANRLVRVRTAIPGAPLANRA